jgi:hypothetical protein
MQRLDFPQSASRAHLPGCFALRVFFFFGGQADNATNRRSATRIPNIGRLVDATAAFFNSSCLTNVSLLKARTLKHLFPQDHFRGASTHSSIYT